VLAEGRGGDRRRRRVRVDRTHDRRRRASAAPPRAAKDSRATLSNPIDIPIPSVLDTNGMRKRLSRSEQVERNGGRVLEAARRVFLAKGYAGASLDAIAEEAGFSKGVVYSQFDSKADLFLTLLERRIGERADQNERIAAEAVGGRGVEA